MHFSDANDEPATTANVTGPAASVDTAVDKRDDRAIYDASVDATVSITAKFADGRVGTASGFFLRDDSYVDTCAHSIQRPRTVENDDGETVLDMDRVDGFPELATEIRVTISAAGGPFNRFVSDKANIVGIDGRDFQSCAVGTVRDGQWVDSTVQTLVTCILTDVSTSKGNSGSPIISTVTGKCIGMHTGAFSPGGTGESTTFGGGIAAYVLCKITDALIDAYRIHSGTLPTGYKTTEYTKYVELDDSTGEHSVGYFRKGILPCQMVANNTHEQMRMQREHDDLNLKFSDDILGFIVTAVHDSPDAMHNIQVGDVITHINGIPIGIYNGHHSIGDVTWFLGNEDEVTLTIQRYDPNGNTVNTTVYQVQLATIRHGEDVTDRIGMQRFVGLVSFKRGKLEGDVRAANRGNLKSQYEEIAHNVIDVYEFKAINEEVNKTLQNAQIARNKWNLSNSPGTKMPLSEFAWKIQLYAEDAVLLPLYLAEAEKELKTANKRIQIEFFTALVAKYGQLIEDNTVSSRIGWSIYETVKERI